MQSAIQDGGAELRKLLTSRPCLGRGRHPGGGRLGEGGQGTSRGHETTGLPAGLLGRLVS